jgi:hypothetical protein
MAKRMTTNGLPSHQAGRPLLAASSLMHIPNADYLERTGSILDCDGKTNRFRATILVTDC